MPNGVRADAASDANNDVIAPGAPVQPPAYKPRAFHGVVLTLLAAVALVSTVQRVSTNDGIDFYNLWGVSAAIRLSGATLGSPYEHGDEYLKTLRAHAAETGDARLASAAAYWSDPDYTGTPLLYTAFAAFPGHYGAALAAFQFLQIAAFIAGCLLLGRLYGLDLFAVSCLALVAFIGFQPLITDLRVANLGCVQFAVLAALIAAARALDRVASPPRRTALASFLFAALAALTLAKPNVALVAGLLAVHLAFKVGWRRAGIGAGAAIAVAIGLVLLSCWRFGSWRVWGDWYRFVYGSDPLRLVRSVSEGNYSTPVILSSWVGGTVYATSLTLTVALVASTIGVLLWRRVSEGFAASAKSAVRRVVDWLTESPDIAVAIGVIATMATSPLFWAHYYVLALIPAFWLMSAPSPSKWVARLGALAVAAASGILALPLIWIGVESAMPVTNAMTWVLLWAGLLMTLRAAR